MTLTNIAERSQSNYRPANISLCSGAFVTRNILKIFLVYFIWDSIRRVALYKITGGNCSGRRGKVGKTALANTGEDWTVGLIRAVINPMAT